MTARHLALIRETPGPSEVTKDTGIVAEAVVFSDGSAVLHWLTSPWATEVYASEADMRKIREFSGRSHFTEDAGAAVRMPDDRAYRLTVTIHTQLMNTGVVTDPRTMADAVAALRAAAVAGHEYACLELTLIRDDETAAAP